MWNQAILARFARVPDTPSDTFRKDSGFVQQAGPLTSPCRQTKMYQSMKGDINDK